VLVTDPAGGANLQWLLGTSANQVASECSANNESPDRACAARRGGGCEGKMGF